MNGFILKLFLLSIIIDLSWQFWAKKEEKKGFWDELSIRLPGFFSGTEKLPITETQAIRKGWKKTDAEKCDGHSIFRGNRYRFKENYGEMLLFDSNGQIAGMQIGVPTSVAMVEKRKYMMPIEKNRYHLTVYFTDPKTICNAPKRGAKDIGDRLLIQTGSNWKSTMNVPMKEKDVKSTPWVKGKCIPYFGTYYWYKVSKKMDCEETFPVFVLYSKGKINGFGWSLKGNFNDPKFDHPDSSLAFMAFDRKTFPECIQKSRSRGSTQHVYLHQTGFTSCSFFG